MAKEQSGRNTLLFLSECGRGVDILNLFRCLVKTELKIHKTSVVSVISICWCARATRFFADLPDTFFGVHWGMFE